jgi:hypothetical protein
MQINYHCKILKHIKKELETSQYALYPDTAVQRKFNDWLRDNRTAPGTPSFLASHCATYHKVSVFAAAPCSGKQPSNCLLIQLMIDTIWRNTDV